MSPNCNGPLSSLYIGPGISDTVGCSPSVYLKLLCTLFYCRKKKRNKMPKLIANNVESFPNFRFFRDSLHQQKNGNLSLHNHGMMINTRGSVMYLQLPVSSILIDASCSP